MQKRFKDKVAIITGAGSAIGRETAIRLAEEGADVILIGKTQQKLLDTAELLPQEDHSWIHDENHMTITCDITNNKQVAKMVNAIIAKFNKIDILINTASKNIQGRVSELSISDWQKSIDVNLTGTFYVSQAVMPYLTASKGNIVNVSSVPKTLNQGTTSSAYHVAKAGVTNLTKSLALECAQNGVRVNSVSSHVFNLDTATTVNNQDTDILVCTKNISAVVAFLASEEASMITGVDIPVNDDIAK